MNKTLFSLAVVCILSCMGVHAQPIMSYGFESKAGTYEEITDGTLILKNDSIGAALNAIAFYGSDTTDRATQLTTKAGISIGFDFVFNNTTMNQFVIGGSGFLAFGKDSVTIDPDSPYFISNTDSEGKYNVVFSIRNAETHGNRDTEISYKITGEPGSRILTVQYKNLRFMDMWGSNFLNNAQLQFKIYENSNKIEIIYKDWKNNSSGYIPARVGIKGSMENDFLMVTSTSNSWSDVSAEPDPYVNISWNSTCYPADGLTYTFTACKECQVPTGQPTNLVLTPKTISISGSFDKTATADYYLTVMTTTDNLSATPQDATFYQPGDTLGNGTVIAFDTLSTFETPETLTGAKQYYFHVFGATSYCMFGPKYNTTQPLKNQIETMPAAPASLEVTENGYDKITLKAMSNAAGDQVLIAITEKYGYDQNSNIIIDGEFGQPTGSMIAGQEIEGGGKVIYIGNAPENLPVENLDNNNLYHFKAWSLNSRNQYSTVGVNANVLTWGKLPYESKLNQMPPYSAPFGWEVNGGFRVENNRLTDMYYLSCLTSAVPVTNELTTPWILLGEGTNRMIFDLNISTYAGRATVLYNEWADNDVIDVQISNDGTSFNTIYTINKDNAPQLATVDSYKRLYIPFDTLSNQKVKFRIHWVCNKAQTTLKLQNIKIEEKSECDYPVDLTVDASSIIGDQALASWISQGEENVWEMRYRVAGEEEWGEPFEVNTNPYLLTQLPSQSNIELQVRAKCSLTSHSVWSDTYSITSGYTVPFTEEFTGTELPVGWEFETGAIADTTVFCEGSLCTKQWRWSTAFYQRGLILTASGTTADEWLLMPVIDLEDGSANYTLSFDITMTNVSADNDEEYYVVISTDGGKTFSKNNIIKTIKKEDLPERNQTKTYDVPLNGYKGQVRLALYVKSTTGRASNVKLAKVSIEASCPSDIVATVSDITPESAKVTWTSEAEEFYVFIRKAGETKKEYEKLTVKEKTFSNLEARTAYEVGITKMCAVGDTAKAVIAAFTSQALAPCEQVTNITTAPSQFSAAVTWEGDAANYNIRYRLKGTENWTTKNTDETSYTIEGLESEKEYEYGIQSICSEADGDQSEWTETKSFTTLAITCFPPTNIQAVPTYKSATITWEGTADNYEIGFRKGTEEWTTSEVAGKTKEFTDLEAETVYSIRLRSICSATDMSAWSSAVEFTTTAIPACVMPTNLTVTGLTATSAKLSWDADESNLSWDIHYRIGTATSWTDEKELTDKTYDLTGLMENTAYIWAVKATCDEGRTSAWSNQNRFTTEASGIDEIATNALNVFVSGNILNVINGEHCLIDNIQVYSLNGQMLNMYTIDSDENVLIPMNLKQTKVLIKINGKDWSKTYPVLF